MFLRGRIARHSLAAHRAGRAIREAIVVRIREAGLDNVAQPIALDVIEPRWPVHERYDAVLCINMIHISPWRATHALFRGAARHLLDRRAS